MKPSVSAKRDGKKITISCSNRPSGVKMNIYRSTKKNSGYKKVKTLTKDSYTDKVKSSTKTYYYKVKFTYKYNKKTYTSKYSKKLTVKKVVKTTGSSINFNTPTYKSGKVKLSWDLVKGAGYYLIHKATSKTGEDVNVFCMGGDESVYYDADVKAVVADHGKRFRVRR